MDRSKLAIGVAVIALLLGASAFVSGHDVKTVVEKVEKVGALSSPDLNSNWVRLGGEELWAWRSTSFITGSTTLCAIKAPQTGSSTLMKVGIQLNTATGTSQTISIYKSSDQYSATTLLASDAIAANGTGNVIATSTALDTKFSVNDWIVIRDVANSLRPQATAPNGACSVLFSQI